MRIALYHNLPSGGAKRTALEFARRLATHHHVDVFTLSCADHDFADLRPWVAGHHVADFEPAPLWKSPLGRLNQLVRRDDLRRLDALAARIAGDIDRGGYDVAFVHPCRLEQSPSVISHLSRTRSVYYCQEPPRVLYEPMPPRPYDDAAVRRRRLLNLVDPLPSIYRRHLERTDRTNLRAADLVLVSSEFMSRTVERIYGVRSTVSRLGVDIDRFRPAALPRKRFVLSVGSLTPLKGFDFLVEAMSRYPAGLRPPLVIASNFQNPLERGYIEGLARRRGVDLQLRGNVTEDLLVQLYNEAAAVVYAPVREPFGLVPLEAMACATPVVAVAEGGVPETVIDGQTGVLTDRHPERFAAAVRALIEDQPFARRCGENGRDHVAAGWTWSRSVQTLTEHLAGAGAGVRPEPAPPALVN